MPYSEAYISVLTERTSGVLLKEQADLGRVGVDARKMAAELDRLAAEFSAANQQQEALKRQLKAQTDVVEALRHRLAVTASGFLDVGIGALGKDTPAGKNLRRMRSDIEREVREATETVSEAPA